MSDASFTATGYAILTEDDLNQKFTSVKKSLCAYSLWSQNIYLLPAESVGMCKRILSNILRLQGHTFCGTPKATNILTDNKSVTRLFYSKITPPPLWNACDILIQFNFIIAHIPGKNNTAADYLSVWK